MNSSEKSLPDAPDAICQYVAIVNSSSIPEAELDYSGYDIILGTTATAEDEAGAGAGVLAVMDDEFSVDQDVRDAS